MLSFTVSREAASLILVLWYLLCSGAWFGLTNGLVGYCCYFIRLPFRTLTALQLLHDAHVASHLHAGRDAVENVAHTVDGETQRSLHRNDSTFGEYMASLDRRGSSNLGRKLHGSGNISLAHAATSDSTRGGSEHCGGRLGDTLHSAGLLGGAVASQSIA